MNKHFFLISAFISFIFFSLAVIIGKRTSQSLDVQYHFCVAIFWFIFPAISFILSCIASYKKTYFTFFTPIIPAFLFGISPLLIFNSDLNSTTVSSALLQVAIYIILGYVAIALGKFLRKKKQIK